MYLCRCVTLVFIVVPLILLISFQGNATSYDAEGINKGEISLSEDNLVIVELFLEKRSLGDSVEIFQHEGGYVVPLRMVLESLEFPINVDIGEKKANGWFITENRNFSLDLNKNEVIVAGIKKEIDSRLIIIGEDDIYIESSLFASWFPIDLNLNFSDLVLHLNPREKLPIQLKEAREKLQEKLQYKFKAPEKDNYPIKTMPYEVYGDPFVDVDFNLSHDKDAGTSNIYSYSVISQGDLGALNARLSFSGQTTDTLDNIRLTAGRKSYKQDLLGPLKATEFQVGDINSVSLANVSSSETGRGLFMTNSLVEKSDKFDTTNFTGYTQPGWDIEIYYNGDLINFQTVGDDGRYEFNDVPIFYGNNNFRIVSYGPQGQIEERTENFDIDDSILQSGTFIYNLGMDEKSKSVFEETEKETDIGHPRRMRYVLHGEYGLFDKLTVGGGYVRTPLQDGIHEYELVSLRSNILGFLTGVDFAIDNKSKGTATQFSANTKVKDISIKMEHLNVDNFISETEDQLLNARETSSKLSLNGRIGSLFPAGLSYQLGSQYETYPNNKSVTTYDNRLSTLLFGASFTNSLNQIKTRDNGTNTDVSSGSFAVRARHSGISWRASADYNLSPTMQITSAAITAQKYFENNLNVKISANRSFLDLELLSLDASINKTFREYRAGLTFTYDSEDAFIIGTKISVSFGKDPARNEWKTAQQNIASTGGLSLRAFLDNNYDDVYNDGDQMLDDVGFIVGGRKVPAEGNKDVYTTGVGTFVPVPVEVDLATVEDPFWQPKEKGYNAVVRPGVVMQMDYPIIVTTEIDGTVYLEQRGKLKAMSRVSIELVNKEGKVVSETKSEFDGFYILSNVIPGDYKIRIIEKHLESLGVINNPVVDVQIKPNSDVMSGIDIIMKDKNSIDSKDLEPMDEQSSVWSKVKELAGVNEVNPKDRAFEKIHRLR